MNLKKYITELKRRKVFKPAITYLIVAWLIAQVFSVVFPAFNAPDYFMKTLIVVLIIGFLINLILAWIYELTPQGIKKTKNMEAETSISAQTNANLNNGNKKLVVLPFHNLSSENGSNYFSDGLTEEIIVRLSAIKELEIASRSTSMRYRDSELDSESLGRELNARYILQGTLRRHKDDLRISTELIDVKKDSTLWAEIYQGNITDVFVIQEQVSKKIVKSLKLKLSPKEKVALGKKATRNIEAHDANLKAREFLFKYTKSYLLLAIDLFQNAIDLDQKYAAAYAGMSEACALLYETHDRNPKWLAKAEESALKALIYDPSSSEAYSALGLAYYNKNSLNEALVAVQKAISFDRDNFFAYWIRGRLYRMMDRDSEAIIDFNKVLEINGDFHSAFGDLQMSYEKLKDKKKSTELHSKGGIILPLLFAASPRRLACSPILCLNIEKAGSFRRSKRRNA